MKVVSTENENNTKFNDIVQDFDSNFKSKPDKCYMNNEEYDDLLDGKNEEELNSVTQLEVLDISNFQYNNYSKMELDNFEETTNMKEELLFNGAVADLVNNTANADMEESNDETSAVVPSKRSLKRKKQLSMSKLQLSVRTTPRHYAKMFDFFEVNPGLATGQLQKICYRKKWRELTGLLNAEGLGEKSTEKWQKTWSDYKLHLRKKISSIKQQGLTEDAANQFTEQEERALAIVGLSLNENSMIQAIQKRFNAPTESEDSSSHSSNPASVSPAIPNARLVAMHQSKLLVQQQRHKKMLLRRKTQEYREKTLTELTLIRRTLNSGLNRIGDILQVLVKKTDGQGEVASQLADAAAALATSASNFAAVLSGNNKRNGNNLS